MALEKRYLPVTIIYNKRVAKASFSEYLVLTRAREVNNDYEQQ
jgi:hypothetical protein